MTTSYLLLHPDVYGFLAVMCPAFWLINVCLTAFSDALQCYECLKTSPDAVAVAHILNPFFTWFLGNDTVHNPMANVDNFTAFHERYNSDGCGEGFMKDDKAFEVNCTGFCVVGFAKG